VKRVLKWLGLLLLALLIVVGVFVFRLWRDREEHRRLREADLVRAPLSAPRSLRPSFTPAAPPDASTDVCLVGVVLDGDTPVPDMQVSASVPGPALFEHDTKVCGCRWCDCPTGRAVLLDDPALGCLEGARSTTSRADGTFTLCGLSEPLPALLWAEHADGRVAVQPGDRTPLQQGAPVTLQVLPTIAIDGVVVDDDGPVSGATVVFLPVTPVRPFRATTDGAGRFSMALPPGPGRALVAAPGRAAALIFADATTAGVMVLRLETPFLLDVRVTHEGRPVEGAEVSVDGDPAERTSGTGEVQLELSRGSSRFVRARRGTLVAAASIVPGHLSSRRLELALVEGLSLRGVVVDEHGAPRVGQVRGGDPEVYALATTAEGHFELRPRPVGDRVYLTAQVPGCASGGAEAFTIAPRLERVRLPVRCDATVRGQVLDADGSPVAGAQVWTKGADVDLDTKTDVSGHFSLQLAPGTAQLLVEQKGYRRHQQPLTAPAADEVIVVLDAGGSISGSVVDAQGRGLSAQPVAAFPADIEELRLGVEGNVAAGFSDRTGRFDLRGLRAGRWIVAALPPDGAPVLSEALALRPGERRDGLELKVEAEVEVSGVVVDARGTPVPGARLEFDPVDDETLMVRLVANVVMGRFQEAARFLPRDTLTGSDGRFVFKAMPVSPMPVKVTATGFEDARASLKKGERARIELRRVARWTVTGRVVDDRGAPLPAFDVNGSRFTPADGRFEVDGHDETHVVQASAPGFLSAQRKVKRNVPSADVGTVQLERAQSLTVRVRKLDGAPLDGARVSTTQGDEHEACETTDVGECAVTPLKSAETRVKVSRKAFAPKEVTLGASDLTRALEVVLEPAGARVEGQVFAAPGRPIAGRRVAALGAVYETSTTDAEGRFSISGLTPGDFCASATLTPGYLGVQWAVPAIATEKPSPVVVGPTVGGGVIEVHPPIGVAYVVLTNGAVGVQPVKGIDTGDADDLCLKWKVTVVTATTTTTRFEGLPPGTWSVFVLSMVQLEERTGTVSPTVVELRPGETRAVE
jgi:uncharacterized GH25 family protein